VRTHTSQLENSRAAAPLLHRLREGGMVLAHVACDGRLREDQRDDGVDWYRRLLTRPTIVRQAIRQAASRWAKQPELAMEPLFEGLLALPIPRLQRRKRTGYAVILIPTLDLASTEHLHAMCQGAGLDFEFCRGALADLAPANEREAFRLAQFARYLLEDHERLEAADATMNSVGRQLAESYEEISLLYTVSQSMTVVQKPQQFVLTACEGLLDTLPYRWIGAYFDGEMTNLRSLAGRLIVAGDAGVDQTKLQRLAHRLIGVARTDAPLVVDPRNKAEYGVFAPLGQPIVVHPISREGRMLGIVIAADKEGDDPEASSADMKLLGASASHTGIFLENAALYEDMDAMFLGTLEALTASIDAKDRYTCGHSQRVAQLSAQLAGAIGLDEQTVRRVHVAGLVHDVGKIGVPEAVLSKPGRLTDAEFDRIKEHPEIGYRILKDIPQLRDVLPGVLHHHERWDGRGYPHGLKAGEIPLFARLIALSDSFDAMSSTRTYRAARDRVSVLSEIETCAGTQFDPDLVPAFVALDFSEFDRLIVEHRAGSHMKGEAA